MDCEVCGRKDVRIDAMIDGVKMRVCDQCARFGKVVFVEPEEGEGSSLRDKRIETTIEIVDDYANLIKTARTKKGMSCKELAAAIAEKESFIDRIEKEQTVPTEKVAQKLEHFLKIKLLEEVAEEGGSVKSQSKSSQGVTLGDMVDVKPKENKK